MVLLVGNSAKISECAMAIERDLGETVESVHTIPQATAKLRTADFAAIVADQSLVEANPTSSDSLWKHAGTAVPVIVNFAINGADRIVRELRAAMTRRQHEHLLAARAAQAALRNELTGAIAGILLSSELALAQPSVPATVADKLRSVHELALQIKSRLGTPA